MAAAPAPAAVRRLLTLTAADLMTTPVTTISEETSLREAARLLHGARITGAPVVDAEGRCVGVLSSSDFVTWAEEGAEQEKEGKAVTFLAPWGELVPVEEAGEHQIRRYMTPDPITVAPTDPIGELAQTMVDFHIHRVLVVEQKRHCGIVTSIDILAALARAARQAEHK